MGSLGFGLNGLTLNPVAGSSVWRPPQWSGPVAVMITVPAQAAGGQYSQIGAPAASPSGNFVFDAVIRLEHEQRFRPTKHPVQTGADITTHIVVEPARLVLDVGISDAQDSYAQGMWVGAPSKSASAYQTLIQIGMARVPFTVTTRLRTYSNMVLVNVPAEETSRTFGAYRGRLEFAQIIIANSTSSTATSARPQDTQSTNLGSVSPQPPSTTIQNQYQVPTAGQGAGVDGGGSGSGTGGNGATTIITGSYASQAGVPGAGNWSSVNTSNLNQLP